MRCRTILEQEIPLRKEPELALSPLLRGFALLGVLLANVPYGNSEAIQSAFDPALTCLYHLLIDKKFITIVGGNIKRLGQYEATIRLHREVNIEFPFEVIAQS